VVLLVTLDNPSNSPPPPVEPGWEVVALLSILPKPRVGFCCEAGRPLLPPVRGINTGLPLLAAADKISDDFFAAVDMISDDLWVAGRAELVALFGTTFTVYVVAKLILPGNSTVG